MKQNTIGGGRDQLGHGKKWLKVTESRRMDLGIRVGESGREYKCLSCVSVRYQETERVSGRSVSRKKKKTISMSGLNVPKMRCSEFGI